MFKGVWQTRLAPAEVDAAIDDCLAYFQARHAPFFFWWLSNATQPRDLGDRLAARGFQAWELNAPGMAADLSHLDYAAMQRVPANFVIEPVTDNVGLEGFKRTFITSYGVPEWAAQAWVDATQSVGIERAPWRIYVGWQNDEPVACTILFNGGSVASVYGVGTVPSARKQGLGAAITLRAYHDALEQGYRYGVLFATEDGLPVYRRIGFKDTGARISRYLWRQPA
jgi:GNAT superfamily N-acetyltransferase